MTIRKLHYFAGIFISAFVAMHLVNHAFSIAGADKHIALMNSLRMVYRNTGVEIILLVCVFLQLISGFTLFRRHRSSAQSFFEKLHIWSGLYLAIFLVIHVVAVLAGRFILQLDTNFYFGVAGLNSFPFNLFFVPYYALAIISFFGHIAAVHSKKMKASLLGLSVHKQSGIILALGIGVTIFIFYGLTNHFRGVQIPPEYNVLIGR